MDTASRIDSSEQLIRWLDSKIDGLIIPSTDRCRIAAACLDMAHEHQKAIVLLTAHKLYGSAAALIRSEFEAYIRGIWVYRCASELAVEKFKKDKVESPISQLINEIEQLEAFDVGVFSRVKALSRGAMNSFAHTGAHQVIRRFDSKEVTPNYTDDEIVDAIDTADLFGLLAALAIADMASDEAFAREILDQSRNMIATEP